MQTILAASDLTKRADRALVRAAHLAAEQGAALVVVKCLDDELPDAIAARREEEAREHLAAVLGAHDADLAAQADIRVETGDPAECVARIAEEVDADLVVLGLHKRSPVQEALRGSTLERIVRATSRTSLLVKNDPEGSYARVLCGLDFSPACAAALRGAHRVAPEAKITAFHAVHIPRMGFFGHKGGPGDPFVKAAKAELRKWMESEALPDIGEPEIAETSVGRAFSTLMTELKPDLVAVGAHARSSFSPTLIGDFARSLIYEPPTDLLIVGR